LEETVLERPHLLRFWPEMALQVLEMWKELARLATYLKIHELVILRS
jgi:hypothetical protein